MDFFPSTSSQADTLANLSPSQVEKKVKKIRDTSGQKCLDLSKNSDRLGLLEKMLVDTLNSVSTPYLRTWRVKVTPRGHLVFQLLASVQTTKGRESGLLPTPNASDNRDRGNMSDPVVQRRIRLGKQVGLSMRVKETKDGGSLNPTWVEWLMGYPKGWTDLNH